MSRTSFKTFLAGVMIVSPCLFIAGANLQLGAILASYFAVVYILTTRTAKGRESARKWQKSAHEFTDYVEAALQKYEKV